jgi:replicative DNA helicase
LRKAIRVLKSLIGEAEHAKSPEEFMQLLQAQVLGLVPERRGQQEISIPEALTEVVTQLLTQSADQSPGLMTGFHAVDLLLNGLKPGNLMIVAARPAMGKTAFAVSLLNHLYKSKSSIASFYSLEMSTEELMIRLISIMTQMNSKDIRKCSVDFNSLCSLTKILKPSDIPFENTISDDALITVAEMRAKCQKKLIKHKKLDLVVVDYLQLMSPDVKSKNKMREQEVSEISRGLKQLAKELKVPVIALSQLNRSLESRPNKRPLLSDLRESGSLEQDADVVAFLYRDEVYNKQTQDRGIGEFIVAKNRHGETGSVKLRWIPEYTAYENITSGM